jgi:nucleoside-diphosphate-sugar epimerase
MSSDFRGALNLGTDELITIDGLLDLASKIAGKELMKRHNTAAPQGVRGRNSDNSLLRRVLGWEPSISLRDGLSKTYPWIYQELEKNNRIPGSKAQMLAAAS